MAVMTREEVERLVVGARLTFRIQQVLLYLERADLHIVLGDYSLQVPPPEGTPAHEAELLNTRRRVTEATIHERKALVNGRKATAAWARNICETFEGCTDQEARTRVDTAEYEQLTALCQQYAEYIDLIPDTADLTVTRVRRRQ
jgi:hypothetical protein